MSDLSHDAALLDIEGTTTSIAFVYDALFPYARSRMRAFLADHFDHPDVQAALSHWEPAASATPESAAQHALALMDQDVKDTGLKGIQGLIWRAGYTEGALKGHVYDDVPDALAAWKAAGVPVYIYSSGSVEAQKQIFGRSEAGDLTRFLSGYFDTTTGPKKVAESYALIADAIGVPPARLMFVTDNLDEARAARAAGVQAVIALRPGNPPLPPHDFPVAERLTALSPYPAA